MPYKRYEVLLPIKYNDGTPVEPDKFTETRLELFDRFGGATFDLVPMSGSWLVETGQAQEEEMVRLVVDVPDTRGNRDFFASWKETLKDRFMQSEIWMIGIPIDVI